MPSRRIRYLGPMGARSFSYLQPDLFFRSGLDSQYGLPSAELLRLTVPTGVEIEFLITEKDSALPGWDRLPDEDALQMCKQVNEIKLEKKGKPLNGTHVFYHVTFGPQATHHHPFSTQSVRDPRNSAEVDAVLSADVNVQVHEDDKEGFEFTATVQASRNFIVLDPNRSNPDFKALSSDEIRKSLRANQAQLQLQLAYAFNAISVGKLKFSFSLLFQLVGGATFQYDPTMKKVALTWGKGAAYGFGLDIEHQSIKHVKLTLQYTQGGSGGSDSVFGFTGPSFDNSIMGGIKIEW